MITSKTIALDIVTGQHGLEFHGYYRGGLGSSESGQTQAKFQLPGTRASYRLGNEPDTNLELQLTYNYKISETDNDAGLIQTVIMLDGYQPHGQTNDITLSNLAQGYISFNQFFDNDIKLWLGRRYYDRKLIHIMDHMWLNPGQNSQAGFGIEDINAGSGKLNIALFRYEDNLNINDSSYLLNSTNIDARWHGLNISSDFNLTLWAGITNRYENTSLNYEEQSGYGLGGWVDYKTENTSNTTVVLYQTGAAITQGDFNQKPIYEAQGWGLENATSFEISNTLTYESIPDYSYQWTILYRQEDHGLSGGTAFDWYSTGIRTLYYFDKHFNIAVEAGIDYIDDDINNRNGSLAKITTALQISAERGFSSRPALRLFVTFADWSEEFKGLIGNSPGNAPYAEDSKGWTIGAQLEVWW